MANIFLDANDSFTQSSTNTGDAIFGRAGGSETVVLQGNPTGTTLDGNVEVVQVATSAANTNLQVNATTGRLELVSGGTVFATFSGGLNQAVNMQFTDGNVTLTQTGANAFTIATPGSTTGAVTINPTTPSAGSAVTLGADKSTAGNTTAPAAGVTKALTSTVEQTFGTTGNDTFTGVDGTTFQNGDLIVDGSATDNDTLTVSATAAFAATATVAGIENIILNQTSAVAAGADLVGINGGTVTLNQLQPGAVGTAAVTKAGNVTLTMGTGITGATTVTQTADTNLIINAGSATGVSQSGVVAGGAGKGSVTINGGTSTTTAVGEATTGSVTLNGDALTTLTGTGKTISASTKADSSTIKVTGVGTTDAATLVIGKTATIDNDTNAVETLTISAANAVTDGSTATITDKAATTYNLTGTNALNLATSQAAAAASLVSGKTVTSDNTGTSTVVLTLEGTGGQTEDLTKIANTVAVNVKGTANATDKLQVADKATVNLTADLTADAEIEGVTKTASSNVLNLGVSSTQTAGVTVTNTSAINLSVTKDSDLSNFQAGTATVTASGSGALSLDNTSVAKSLDASAMTGKVTATAGASTIATITGGSGNDQITLTTAETVTVNGGAGTGDEVIFGADSTKATFSNFETGTLAANTTFKASQLDGVAMVLNGAFKVKVDGNATMDKTTLDLSKFAPGTITGFDVIVDAAADFGPTVAAGQALTITGSSIADTITLSATSGANTISSGAGDDVITDGTGNDTIDVGKGADQITLSGGKDTITLGTDTDIDVVTIADTNLKNANTFTLKGFTVENAVDTIAIDDATNIKTGGAGNISDGLVAGELQSVTTAATSYTIAGGEIALELAYEFDAGVDLDTATAAQILSAIGAADNGAGANTAGTITAAAAADAILIIAYQSGNAYLFEGDSGTGDTKIGDGVGANDAISLVGVIEGIAVGSLSDAHFA